MNTVDLHCHTTASDGALTPAQLVQRAARLGLKAIAITDHDSTDGVAPALEVAPHYGIEVIPGVEINTDVPGTEVHILGYFLDHADPSLNGELARLRDGRIGRARRMAEKLAEMGAPIRFERILEIAGEGAVGRPHVAQALLEAGYVTSFDQAFEKYIGRDSPAYVERLKFSPAQACALIRRAGGVPVLAHPVFFDRAGAIKAPFDLDVMLPELIEAGLMGLEVYYPGYDAVTTAYLIAVARRYRLLHTGGTDFHGVRAGEPDLGGIYVPMKAVRRLREAWQQLR
ncbi:MAG: PHP domain-containing protein [Anaerolineae bacterium]|nr:PHP domain-containing protein [Anaerolineae bacterium]